MSRNGYPEETYYTFSFSPVPEEDGSIGGLVCANNDDSDRVIGARRLALLREIAARTWEAKSVADVYGLAARALASDTRDMPFALIYRFEDDGARATLRGHSGIEPGHVCAPETIALDAPSLWPVSDVVCVPSARRCRDWVEMRRSLPQCPGPMLRKPWCCR